MNKIIVIRGPLGVGKTTIAKLLAKEINAEYISLDQIMKENNLEGKNSISVENYLQANNIISKTIKDLSADRHGSKKTFIIDGCFYYQKQIDDLKNKFPNIIFFSLVTNIEKCIERDSQRKKVYGEESVRYIHMITTKIKEGYEIDNTNLSITETTDSIMDILEKIK